MNEVNTLRNDLATKRNVTIADMKLISWDKELEYFAKLYIHHYAMNGADSCFITQDGSIPRMKEFPYTICKDAEMTLDEFVTETIQNLTESHS